jgi:SulP family sulfate permease
VLIFAAIGSLRPAELRTILRTGRISQIAVVATFLATLFLPVAAAVGFGVVISLLLQLNQEAMDLVVVQLVPRADGRFNEYPAPSTLPSATVTVLDVYGSLFYAGARTLQSKLPYPTGADEPVVVLRLRGRTSLGATFFVVVADYAQRLRAVGGRLYLSGLDHELAERLRGTGRVDVSGPVHAFEATSLVGESTQEAYLDAQAWMVEHRDR